MSKLTICALALVGSIGAALGQESVDPGKVKELKKQDTVPPATGKGGPEQAGTQEPSSKVQGTNSDSDVFVNGALAVPGSPPDVDTIPSKFSTRNAASDKLPIAAFRLKHLTDDQKREIAEQLTSGRKLALAPGGGADQRHAVVGAQIPAEVALRDLAPVPDAVAAKFPDLRDAAFMRSGERLLLIDPRNRLVIGVLPVER